MAERPYRSISSRRGLKAATGRMLQRYLDFFPIAQQTFKFDKMQFFTYLSQLTISVNRFGRIYDSWPYWYLSNLWWYKQNTNHRCLVTQPPAKSTVYPKAASMNSAWSPSTRPDSLSLPILPRWPQLGIDLVSIAVILYLIRSRSSLCRIPQECML